MIETALACVSANLPLLRPLLNGTLAGSQWFWYPFRLLKTKLYNVGSMEPVVAAVGKEVGEDSVRSEFSFERFPHKVVPDPAPDVREKFNPERAVGAPVPQAAQKVEAWFNNENFPEANQAPGSSPGGSVPDLSNSAKSDNSLT
jgi:hypothetical protein